MNKQRLKSIGVICALLFAVASLIMPSVALADADIGTSVTVIGSSPSVNVETAADGSGTIVPGQAMNIGESITVYAIHRNSADAFLANVAASWSLASKTDGVQDGDLVPAGDNKSATFTANAAGTAVIRASYPGLVSNDSGTIQVLAATTSVGAGGGGGGGGGGGSSGIIILYNRTNDQGELLDDLTLGTPGFTWLVLPKGTVCLSADGSIPPWIKINFIGTKKPYPVLPEEGPFIDSYYDLGPHGATFDPPLELTMDYDPLLIPAGFGEDNLRIATFDETTEKWGALDTGVNTAKLTVATSVGHFSRYAIVVVRKPATVTFSRLFMVSEIYAGDGLVIEGYAENSGDVEGFYETTLKINGKISGRKALLVPAHDKVIIHFEVDGLEAGKYTIELGGITKELTVLARPGSPAETTPEVIPSNTGESPVQGTVASPQVTTSQPPVTTSTEGLPLDDGSIWWLFLLIGCAGVIVVVLLVRYHTGRQNTNPFR